MAVLVGYLSTEKLVCLDMLLNTHPRRLNEKKESQYACVNIVE